MYQIVTGVTSDVGVPSIYLIDNLICDIKSIAQKTVILKPRGAWNVIDICFY